MPGEALMQSKELFRALIEHSNDAITLITSGGTIMYANPSTSHLSGYPLKELEGMNCFALIHPDDQGAVREQLAHLIGHHEETFPLEYRLGCKNGTWRRIEGTATNFLDNPRIGAIVCNSHATTKHKLFSDDEQATRALLQDAEARANQMTTIFEAMTDGVVVCDANGLIQFTNSAFRTLFSLHSETNPALLPPNEQSVWVIPHLEEWTLSQDQGPSLRVLREGSLSNQQTIDLICHNRTGQKLFLNVSGTTIYDASGQVTGGVAVYRDVTERHYLEQQLQYAERKFRSLVESNIVAVMVTDQEGRMYEVNNRLVQQLGYSQEELLNGNIRVKDILVSDYQSARTRAWKTLISQGASLPEEKEYIRKNGSHFPALVAAVTINQERNRALVMLLDISDRREAEQRKQEFLGMVSHELRTPLTVIQGFLELMLLYVDRLSEASSIGTGELLNKLEAMLQQALRQAEIETRLVAELLDVSRMEMQKFEMSLQLCNLTTIVQQVVANQQQMAPTRCIELVLPSQEQIPIVADADRIEQVLTNYLTNSFKYSAPGQPVRVQVSVEELMVRVSVSDHGSGLTLEQQQRVWECFYQAENTRQRGFGGGLGLGLYIVRTIIAQHQGQVGVESRPGQGSTFWFMLPLADELL
jgi:PAS domain S-box-containing protein